jgi:tRNA (guanine-N7-)-methyltransferase
MDGNDGAPAGPRRKLYGRRHGKRLKESQKRLLEELLPRLRIPGVGEADDLDFAALFGERPVWLEVGFGGGELLVAQALANPGVGLIGCEPFINGVAKALAGIAASGVGNVRLHPGDARDLIELLPPASLERVFLLYPDPWPKARHAARRFASRENLALLAPAVAGGAELRIATDIEAYAEHALAEAAQSPGWRIADDGPTPWAGWPGTRYEAKALQAGRRPRYITLLRV